MLNRMRKEGNLKECSYGRHYPKRGLGIDGRQRFLYNCYEAGVAQWQSSGIVIRRLSVQVGSPAPFIGEGDWVILYLSRVEDFLSSLPLEKS